MSKKLNMADLLAIRNGEGQSEEAPETATFLAETLTVTVTDPNGNVVLQTKIEPRGFKAKEDRRSGRVAGGVGWYGDVKAKDGGSYRGLPVSAGLRLSLDIPKVAPGTVIDLLGE